MIEICSGITSGRVLNGELYAQRLQKLTYLYLLTGCFMKISLQSSEQSVVGLQSNNNNIISTSVGLGVIQSRKIFKMKG